MTGRSFCSSVLVFTLRIYGSNSERLSFFLFHKFIAAKPNKVCMCNVQYYFSISLWLDKQFHFVIFFEMSRVMLSCRLFTKQFSPKTFRIFQISCLYGIGIFQLNIHTKYDNFKIENKNLIYLGISLDGKQKFIYVFLSFLKKKNLFKINVDVFI